MQVRPKRYKSNLQNSQVNFRKIQVAPTTVCKASGGSDCLEGRAHWPYGHARNPKGKMPARSLHSVRVDEQRSYSSTFKIAMKASCGTSTLPMAFMRFLPAFCFSRSFRLRDISPP